VTEVRKWTTPPTAKGRKGRKDGMEPGAREGTEEGREGEEKGGEARRGEAYFRAFPQF